MRELICGLARPMLRLFGRDDRGAIGVLVAALIGGGVLLGMGALVLDVGQLYQERAELQNGADAAALAVARNCIKSTCTLSSSTTVAGGIANLNASKLTGHQEKVDWVCGSDGLGTCPTSTSPSITNCPPPPPNLPAGANWADVHTSTQMPSGSPLLPPVLARALLGNGSYQGTDVAACAQVEWGPAGQSNSLALTVSLCAWEGLTGDTDYLQDNGVEYSANGPQPTQAQLQDEADDAAASPAVTEKDGYYIPIPLFLKGKAKTCADQGAGLNAPGAFDWLNTDTDHDGENNSDTDKDGDASNSCSAYINVVTSTTYNNTGSNVSQACQTALENDISNQVEVFIPVFISTQGTGGQNITYTVAGLAGFMITGFTNMPFTTGSGSHSDGADGKCISSSTSGGNAPCIQGYFLPGLDPVGTVSKVPSIGPDAVQLTG